MPRATRALSVHDGRLKHPINLTGLLLAAAALVVQSATAQNRTASPEITAQQPPADLIPRQVLFGNPEKTDPQLSPDGTQLGYLAPHKGVLNVWVRTIGKDDDQVVTSDKKRGIRFFGWQWDGQHILYIQDRDGDENWHLYQTNLKTKMTRDLTPFEGVQARPIAHEPEFPETFLVGLNIRDGRFHDVYRINLKNGAVELEAENPGDVTDWTADNALRVRAAQAFTPDGGTIIRVRDDSQGPWREFQQWSPDETFGGVVGFTPDNKGLRLISSVGANAARLLEVDLATGASRVVAEDPHYDVSDVMTHPKTRKLEAVAFTRARREWHATGLASESVALLHPRAPGMAGHRPEPQG